MTPPEFNKIHLGDCLAAMKTWPDKCVDITVTSPPYNTLPPGNATGGHHNNAWVSKSKAGVGYSDDLPEDEYQVWVRAVIAECLRVSKGTVWVNHKTRYRDGVAIHPRDFLPFPYHAEVIWDRRSSMVMNAKKYMPSHEVIFGFGKPHYWDPCLDGKMSVWCIPPRPQGLDHPCPYPLEMVAPLITSSCPEGGVVLDPFMGSGTTALAVLRANRQYVGFDLSEKYIAIARSRLDAETAQGKLF